MKSVLTAVVIIVLIAAGALAVVKYSGKLGGKAIGSGITLRSPWQAVFLSSGQVYFGKITKLTDDFIVLENIYYLQVLTRQNTIGQPPDVQTQPEQQLTLIKLGQEIHGPRDEMMINRDQVTIIEDLREDGRVVLAINDYLERQARGETGQPDQPLPAEPQPAE